MKHQQLIQIMTRIYLTEGYLLPEKNILDISKIFYERIYKQFSMGSARTQYTRKFQYEKENH